MKKLITLIFLSIPMLTNAQIAKGDWIIEGAVSPLVIPKIIYARPVGITPIKVLYAPNNRILIGLNTSIFRDGVGYLPSRFIDISPSFQHIFLNKKRFMAFGEASVGYSRSRNTQSLMDALGVTEIDPLICYIGTEAKTANGFNASLGMGFRLFVFKNVGIQTTLSYINLRASFTENGFSKPTNYSINANHLAFNTGVFFRLHKTK